MRGSTVDEVRQVERWTADAAAAFDESATSADVESSTDGPLPSIARRRAFRQVALDLDHRPSRREQWTAEMAALFETAS